MQGGGAVNVKPYSHLAVEASSALCLRRIQYCVITDEEQRESNQGHGYHLREKGFYPIGHRSGMIVLSYYDEVQKAIIYEKLIFVKAVPRSRMPLESGRVHALERLIAFEED